MKCVIVQMLSPFGAILGTCGLPGAPVLTNTMRQSTTAGMTRATRLNRDLEAHEMTSRVNEYNLLLGNIAPNRICPRFNHDGSILIEAEHKRLSSSELTFVRNSPVRENHFQRFTRNVGSARFVPREWQSHISEASHGAAFRLREQHRFRPGLRPAQESGLVELIAICRTPIHGEVSDRLSHPEVLNPQLVS